MVYYIDGDNVGISGTEGIQNLSPETEVNIYYHLQNGYWSASSNRQDIAGTAACRLRYTCVEAAANAADFAVMRDASACLENNDSSVVVLVSRDNQFRTIERQLKGKHPGSAIVLAESIKEGFLKTFMLDVRSLSGLQDALRTAYGEYKGSEAYERVKKAFLDSLN